MKCLPESKISIKMVDQNFFFYTQHINIYTLTCCLRGKGPVKRYKSHRQRKGREPLWQKKLLSESVDKVQTMAAEMREDKVKQLFFTDCAVYKLCA